LADAINEQDLDATLSEEGGKLYLNYQAVRPGNGYVRSTVLLEFGARSTGEPAEQFSITCDIVDALMDLDVPTAQPRVMNAERTFWEKATAIHAYCLKGSFRGGDRYARHWYDLDCLGQVGIAQTAIENRDLGKEVARNKQYFFRENDQSGNLIDYAAAVGGQIQLIPTGPALEALKLDYQAMLDAGLLRPDAASFEDLINRLEKLQHQANVGKD